LAIATATISSHNYIINEENFRQKSEKLRESNFNPLLANNHGGSNVAGQKQPQERGQGTPFHIRPHGEPDWLAHALASFLRIQKYFD